MMSGLPAPDKALLFYRELWRIRIVEESIAARYSEQEMRCPVHLSTGQEASAVGVCQALRTSDPIFSTHRSHAHYLAKGGDLERMLAEIYGKESGCIGGRGGSMHLMDPPRGMIASIPIVASSIPLAAGAALAHQIDGNDLVSVAFFGDAAVEEGVFHETLNFARLRSLPVLFVCENNFFSIYTPLHRRQPDRPITALAEAHGIPAQLLDGNDVSVVYTGAVEAVERARRGEGPTFLQLDTYRWREHCGPNVDDELGYRSADEVRQWRERCPIERLQRQLSAEGLLDPDEEKRMLEELRAEADSAFEFARSAPLPEAAAARGYEYAPSR